MRRVRKWILLVLAGVMLLCLAGAILTMVTNQGLPTESEVADRLSNIEKARLEETFHLRESLGEAVWTGWSQADIPTIVYNESYAFLTGYQGDPPSGWVMMPRNQKRGAAWEEIPGETLHNLPVYRQALPDPERTPENFTVKIGDRWAATMQTWEYSEVAFYSGFREDLPGFVQPVFPYQMVWNFLLGSTETYLGGLSHEAFHAYQGMLVPERLAEAEYAAPLEDQYPWDDQNAEDAWKNELELLVRAVKAETDTETAGLARQFLIQRTERRNDSDLSVELVDYERKREWLEGLAKYSELALVHLAATTPDYEAIDGLEIDPKFDDYSNFERFFDQQIQEVGRMTGHEAEIRFYYSGMAQAFLLDRLFPGWKEQIFLEEVWLEDLLAQAVQ